MSRKTNEEAAFDARSAHLQTTKAKGLLVETVHYELIETALSLVRKRYVAWPLYRAPFVSTVEEDPPDEP